MVKTLELIGRNLKRAREILGLSQKEIAAASHIPQGQYSRIENGLVEPSISTLEKLTLVMEIPLADLFKSEEVPIVSDLTLIEKIKLLDGLEQIDKQSIFRLIDLAVFKKNTEKILKEFKH